MATAADTQRELPCTKRSGSEPLHVVHGVLSLDVGGLERIVLDLVRVGRGQGHRVSVICVERTGGLAEVATQLGAEVFSLEKPPGRDRRTTQRCLELLRRLQPDVIHTHQLGALWYLGRAARQRGGIAVLHTEHGNARARAAGPWQRMKLRVLLNRAAKLADRFCCVSQEIADAVTAWTTVSRGKVELIPNGIETERFTRPPDCVSARSELGIPATATVIGTVGRLSEVKRQDLLLRVLARMDPKAPGTHLLIVGDGPERNRLEETAAVLRISGQVIFAGYQPRPERFLHAMDVFALTSRSEGLPVSLLEAWAAGLPVVCSAVGGIPSVVTHGQNGLLVPFGSENALEQAFMSLIADRALAERLARVGEACVRSRYSLANMAGEYDRRYRDLVNGRAA
jgi:glycosyltransferase involved in cell wall biosynthesis